MKNKKSLLWKVPLLVFGALIVLPATFVGITTWMAYGKGDPVKKDATISNETGLVQAKGKALFDAEGKKLILRGVNAGMTLVSEPVFGK